MTRSRDGSSNGARHDAPASEHRPHHGAARDRSALADLAAPPGLCATCRHLDLVGSKRSVFVRCALSDTDPRFPRYPPLPVRRCAGHEPLEADGGAAGDGSGGDLRGER